jgi:hypothetical protein
MMLKRMPSYIRYFSALMLILILTSCGGGVSSNDTRAAGSYTGTAQLSWQPLNTYTDNTTLIPAGYRIYYGTASKTYSKIVDIPISSFTNTNAPSYELTNLPPGTYYFAVSVYDASRVEGALSNEASKTIQ